MRRNQARKKVRISISFIFFSGGEADTLDDRQLVVLINYPIQEKGICLALQKGGMCWDSESNQ